MRSVFATCALLIVLLATPAVRAMEIPEGSGCHMDRYGLTCELGKEQAIVCGILFDANDLNVQEPQPVKVTTYDPATDEVIDRCETVTGRGCGFSSGNGGWILMEWETACGNGKLFWRHLFRATKETGLEGARYSEQGLECIGLRNDRTMAAMAMFNMLIVLEAPHSPVQSDN